MKKIPEGVWHGSFIPDGTDLRPDGLFGLVGFTSTSELRATAAFFAGKKRWQLSDEPGRLFLFRVRTSGLEEETKMRASFKEGLVPTLREWRFFEPIPWSVIETEKELWLPTETRFHDAFSIATYCDMALLGRIK